MQLLETFYVHADRNFRTMMESPIEEGTTMTICGDTHGQWEDFCTIMDMNGLPSESNRVRSRRPGVRGAVAGTGSHGLFGAGVPALQYLYNGDFVDRGPCGVEIALLLFAFNLADPKCMMINRGNHECYPQNFQYVRLEAPLPPLAGRCRPLTRVLMVVTCGMRCDVQGFVDEVLTKYGADFREKIFWGFQVGGAIVWFNSAPARVCAHVLPSFSSPPLLCSVRSRHCPCARC